MLEGKVVLLGISGGIAAYKSAELARLLVKEGCTVQVVMTKAACEFISPLTMRTLTGRPVYSSLFESTYSNATAHIDLAREPHMVIVAPATANIIGKMRAGIADNLLTTVLMAIDREKCPVVFSPSMNSGMFSSPAVKDNISVLRQRGYVIVEPGEGFLACGEVGEGRMVEPSLLVEKLKGISEGDVGDYAGLTVMVTAGPTREALDPVRFFGNHSTGKMGYALARAASERGAKVILISGPTPLEPPENVYLVNVSTAREMYNAVLKEYPNVDIVIKTAAVADYRPEKCYLEKIKKGDDKDIKLVRNPDILKELGYNKKEQFLVGFAAETEDLLENATTKMEEKNLDMVVANDLNVEGAGFAAETNVVHVLYRNGFVEEFPIMSKYELAHTILKRIINCRSAELEGRVR